MVDYWLKNILNACARQACLLCGGAADIEYNLALCKACRNDLPVLGETCQQCANPLENRLERLEALSNSPGLLQTRLCGQCLQQRPYFDHSIAFFPYLAPFDHLVQAAKFRGKLATAHLCGQLLAEPVSLSLASLSDCPDALLAVPLHRSRQHERGYNQALEIARPVARQTGLPILRGVASRVKAAPPQSSLSLKQRRKNVHNAFKIQGSVANQHIAIIDDVMTSGATVNALAKALKQAGARRVSVWCFCRADAPS